MSISAAAMKAVTTLAQNPAQRAVTITRPTAARRMISTRSGGTSTSWITTATATRTTEIVTRPMKDSIRAASSRSQAALAANGSWRCSRTFRRTSAPLPRSCAGGRSDVSAERPAGPGTTSPSVLAGTRLRLVGARGVRPTLYE